MKNSNAHPVLSVLRLTTALLIVVLLNGGYAQSPSDTLFCTHKVVLDEQQKIIPWYSPRAKAYDHFLHLRWNFVKTKAPNAPGPPPRSLYPQYYFYCAFKENNGVLEPDTWMNDIGEKIPNWFESARLYYAYTGDSSVIKIVKDFLDYTLEHGTSPSTFAWPNFPYTTANAGDTLFQGFTSAGRLALHEIQVDHAGEMGLTYYRMFLFTGDKKYLDAALNVADVLAQNARRGSAKKSVWPYRVIMETGQVTASYGANWTGCYLLLDNLIRANLGNVRAYKIARDKARRFLLKYPMKTGYWTDGHTDTDINSHTYKSNLSASNMTLCLFDHPELDPDWKKNIPRLIKWTEDNFVFRSAPGEPSTQWGANVVGEQDTFMHKMDYQTARYAASCARWYAVSGDESFKEKAYRSLNWVTYCNNSSGMAFESPVSKGILSWWSDCYGECPRMFYQAFAGVPEWAPPGENHILYSEGILKDVHYASDQVMYTAAEDNGIEYLRLAFKPQTVTLNGKAMPQDAAIKPDAYTLTDLGNNDYAMVIQRSNAGHLVIAGSEISIHIDGAVRFQKMNGFGVNVNTSWWLDGDYRDTDVVKPAIDLLAEELGATIFRAVIEDMDWETANDNDDPNTFNWSYYDSVFTTNRFHGVWNTLRYLNQKGITNDLIISFMGAPPASKPLEKPELENSWMGDSTHTIGPEKEDEFVETIAALLYYARHKANIQFTLVSPMNETEIISVTKNNDHPDGIVEGPNMPDPVQFTRVIKKLAVKLDAIGMSDIRFIAPDAAGDKLFSAILDEMVIDSWLIGKLACWGVHDYGNDAANYQKIVSRPANPNKSFWVTETAAIGNLFGQLDDNASAFIFWDGFDCVYQHARRNGYGDVPPNDWAFWLGEREGTPLIKYDAGRQNWTPRKQFYEYAQLFKFIKPGAVRIAATSEKGNPVIYAFVNPDRQLVVVGRNDSADPITIRGNLKNISKVKAFEMFYTDSLHDLFKAEDVAISDNSFEAVVPADAVFTLIEKTPRLKPEPDGWYAGDMHGHRDCGGPKAGILPENKFVEMMAVNDLAVISVLADMGNGEVQDSHTDLPQVNGADAVQSMPGRIVHWDAEWHFDPAGVTFENKALGGHLVFLGLKEAHRIWDESPYKIIEWGKKQQAIVGFCHMQYLDDFLTDELDCCTPIDFPVEAALRTIDFLAEDVWLNDAAVSAYYKILNCGFRLGWAAGTDYPCNNGRPFGDQLTYVEVKDQPLTYQKWIEGIKNGRTVVSMNGHKEFLDLKVGTAGASPGDEIKLEQKSALDMQVTWTSVVEQAGRIELVCNGHVIAVLPGTAKPGEPVILQTSHEFPQSSWICARRMGEKGHQSHTAPVYITVRNAPVRASAQDAQYFVRWIDKILVNIAPGGPWNQYFSHDLGVVEDRYRRARAVYEKIALEAESLGNP